jgi:hypothetical protein
LDEELKKLPIEDALAYQQAIQKCPLLALSKKHKLMFLRCEQFRCDVSYSVAVILIKLAL